MNYYSERTKAMLNIFTVFETEMKVKIDSILIQAKIQRRGKNGKKKFAVQKIYALKGR